MREAFEEAWLAPEAEAWLAAVRFLGRAAWDDVDAFCGISHPESELAREPKARPPSKSPCQGVRCQSWAISASRVASPLKSESAQTSAGPTCAWSTVGL